MQISNIGLAQSFGAKTEKTSKTSLIDQFSSVLDSSSKDIGTVADVIIATKNAVDTPEETTLRVMSEKLDNVVESEKSPSWVKKPLKYIVAATVGIGAWFATSKGLKAPGKIMNFAKKQLAKSKSGTSILKFASNMKEKTIDFVKAFKFKDKSFTTSINDFFNGKKKGITKFIKKHFPETRKKFLKFTKSQKLDKLNVKDYIRNGIGLAAGITSGKKYIDKKSISDAEDEINSNFDEIDDAA